MYMCLCIYICSYHWILLVLCIESGNFVVFDSMRCPQRNPTLHRPIEQVSTICTIKSFSFLDQLFNIKLNFRRMVWKQFVIKNKGAGQWKEELDVKMSFPVLMRTRPDLPRGKDTFDWWTS